MASMCIERVGVSTGRREVSTCICVKAPGGGSNARVSDAEDDLLKRLQAPLRRASALSKALTTLTSGEMVWRLAVESLVMIEVAEEK